MKHRAEPITYVIYAHDRPADVLRLANAVLAEAPSSRIVIHYSALSGPFGAVADDRISLVEDAVAVHWGSFSLTDMMLRALDHIERHGLPDAWVVMLSGQSYPVRPVSELEAMLAGCGADAYFWHEPIGPKDRQLRERFTFRYRILATRALPFPLNLRAVRGIVNRVQPFIRIKSNPKASFLGLPRSRSIFNLVPTVYHATQWIALARSAVATINDVVRSRPELVDAYRDSNFAEESFFATVLSSVPNMRIISDDIHYTDWSTIRTGSPRTLDLSDLPQIESSGRWFARKINLVSDGGLRDALDRRRASPSPDLPGQAGLPV